LRSSVVLSCVIMVGISLIVILMVWRSVSVVSCVCGFVRWMLFMLRVLIILMMCVIFWVSGMVVFIRLIICGVFFVGCVLRFVLCEFL